MYARGATPDNEISPPGPVKRDMREMGQERPRVALAIVVQAVRVRNTRPLSHERDESGTVGREVLAPDLGVKRDRTCFRILDTALVVAAPFRIRD
jgi:hypothetical protein